MEEQIVEVNENDEVIGLRPRSKFYTGKYIHRSVHLLLFNSKNEVLLQKRAPTKKWYPNLYTFSTSGTVANESYEDCLKREIREEIGLSIPVKFLFKFFLNNEGVEKAFHAIFIGKSDNEIKPDECEISEVKWVSIKELLKGIREHPEKYAPDLVEAGNKYFMEFYGHSPDE